MASTVHVLSAMGLLGEKQSEKEIPPDAPPKHKISVCIHNIAAMISKVFHYYDTVESFLNLNTPSLIDTSALMHCPNQIITFIECIYSVIINFISFDFTLKFN